MLIEMHTLREMVDTQVLPAGYAYAGALAKAAADAKAAGITVIPQQTAANTVGKLVSEVQAKREKLDKAIAKAEGMHDALEEQAKFLTSTGADAMAAVREASDALELAISDEQWPLPKYREMLFPV
jgi:glutamine synthetase